MVSQDQGCLCGRQNARQGAEPRRQRRRRRWRWRQASPVVAHHPALLASAAALHSPGPRACMTLEDNTGFFASSGFDMLAEPRCRLFWYAEYNK